MSISDEITNKSLYIASVADLFPTSYEALITSLNRIR